MPLLLASPAIQPGGEISSQYTCEGADISPPLTWSGLPDRTRSLVLVVENPDALSGALRHWAVLDIPAASRGLDGGFSANRPAAGLRQARNDFGKPGDGAPCPPKGHGTHHYHFRVLAISRPTLDLKRTASVTDVLRTAQPYAIQVADLVGTYHR